MDTILEALRELRKIELDESAKTDFIDKFGETTFNNFVKAKERLVNKGLSTDFGQYLKKSKKEVDDLILSLYDDTKDAQKKRIIQGLTSNIRGRYKFLGEKGGYLVYQPLNYIASMDLGVNTGWCTTGRYGHAGHPDFTPSEKDAKEHFNKYTKAGIKLYYFLNPTNMYGEYAIALYPELVPGNGSIYRKQDGKDYQITETNVEIFDSLDNTNFNDKIIDIALELNIPIMLKEEEVKVIDKCLIKNNVMIGTNTEDKDLTSIEIPSGVKKIEARALYYYDNLTSVTLPNSLKSIGYEAFAGCTKLQNITIPNSVTRIDGDAFSYCENLTSIILPERLSNISAGLFYNCVNLKNVRIPDSVTNIGKTAFSNCYSLKNIIYNGTKENWNSIIKGDRWNENTGNYIIHCIDDNLNK